MIVLKLDWNKKIKRFIFFLLQLFSIKYIIEYEKHFHIGGNIIWQKGNLIILNRKILYLI